MTAKTLADDFPAPNRSRQRDHSKLWLNVRDPGGPWIRAFTDAYYAPFEAETGIRINRKSGHNEPTSPIKEMVDNGSYEWDVALTSMSTNTHLANCDRSYLEVLDLDTPGIREISAEYKSPTFIGNDVYTNVLAYRTDAFSNSEAPRSWADFWNVRDFPGRRSIRQFPMDTMEVALLADGVAPEELYPLDVQRAFRSLERIREHITLWWSNGDQQSELMTGNQVDMCSISNLRAQGAIDAGAPVGVCWNQNVRTADGWSILRGSPRADLGREFIRFAASAERQAVFTKYVTANPSIASAKDYIAPERVVTLPDHPDHIRTSIASDAVYWSREKDGMIPRFADWFERGR